MQKLTTKQQLEGLAEIDPLMILKGISEETPVEFCLRSGEIQRNYAYVFSDLLSIVSMFPSSAF